MSTQTEETANPWHGATKTMSTTKNSSSEVLVEFTHT